MSTVIDLPDIVDPTNVWSIVQLMHDLVNKIQRRPPDIGCLFILQNAADRLSKHLEGALGTSVEKYKSNYVKTQLMSETEFSKLLPKIIEAASSMKRAVPNIESWVDHYSYGRELCVICGLVPLNYLHAHVYDKDNNPTSLNGICESCRTSIYMPLTNPGAVHRERFANYINLIGEGGQLHAADTARQRQNKYYKRHIISLFNRFMYNEFSQIMVKYLCDGFGDNIRKYIF